MRLYHGFFIKYNASHTSLFPMELKKKMCERQILALYQQLHTKHYIKRYKQQVYKFTKTTITIKFNILQVFPSVPAFCLAYFHVSLNLMAVLTV